MKTELIKLKVKATSSIGGKALIIMNTFTSACERLDASIFEPLIEEDQYFQDLNKYKFLESLKNEFDLLKGRGFSRTTMIKGTCKGCHCGDRVYQFYTNRVYPAFAYIIHEQNNQVVDIFMCNLSDGMQVVDLRVLENYNFWK
ncbi:hypothetical protein WNY78_02505 [Psychroserpens sp. AS72]|uniref:hypothetical protein n=1 Tax=Psychroserpens sp. AS72 TaxID=3135775 RepID=UPI003175ECB5